MLLACAAVHRLKDCDPPLTRRPHLLRPDPLPSPVCITSGISYLGRAVINRLLLRGYSVRIMVDNQEDLEKLREMETTGEMGRAHSNFRAKSMAEIEVKTTEGVMEACVRTPFMRKCVLTSSLLACVWREHTGSHSSPVIIDHDSWMDEPYCLRNKLWYALGNLRAERVAWRIAEERGLRLTAIRPGPEFCNRNPTATIAYLKGAKEMYVWGLLAVVDAMKLPDVHVREFEEMGD
ncbi:hypothetical protein MLD38_033959 [Melastoma candidum]|uniref:Uncharacterized protein n=1 Tax=Melastoma candidum TaxID=119954 RepID=A0ACB9M8D3_9MYRT|nr:hypothetical protein MLD38_033959 [Melastoma candidum]